MAKPYYEDYKWFVSLNWEQWTRSQSWITDKVLSNYHKGIFTSAQVSSIWKYYEGLAKQKMDAVPKKPPIIDQSTDRGDYIGSATAPKDPPKEEDLSLWDRFNAAMTRMSDKLNGDLDAVGDKLGDTLDPGKWFNIVVLIGGFFLVLKIFKK